MPIDYSFINRSVPPLNLQDTSAAPVDPQQALVDRLLASLEPSPVPPPPQLPPAPTGGRQILGNIGDALRAMAAVRTGAQPPLYGPFAASEMKRQEETMALQREYAKETAAARSADRNERNRIRAEAGIVSLRNQHDLRQANLDERTRHNLAMENRPAPPGYTLGYDENGTAMWFQKPTGTGAGGVATPVTGVGGKTIKKTSPANLAGIQQQLDNTSTMLDEMKANWLQRPKSGFMQGVGTAGANLLSRGVGANLGLSGVASMIDQHAVIHERDREALATTLAFPLTGSRRSVEGARKSLLDIIPHYTDPPEVWNEFEKQMRYMINSARRMPWGEQPTTSQEAYGSMLDAMIAASGSSSAGPYSGKTLHESDFANAKPGERERFVSGGGKVEP